MFKKILFTAALTAAAVATASATPISGSFSLASFGGTYNTGTGTAATAATATGIDFGLAGGSVGNGYGTNGTAFVGNTTGSFAGLTSASISDISLDSFANPYTVNPFISFTGSNIVLSFSNASFTRSPLGTSITITGTGTFSDGIAADASTGMFSLATSSQNGMSSSANLTFTSNASTSVAVTPEPTSLALLGTGLLGIVGVARKRFA